MIDRPKFERHEINRVHFLVFEPETSLRSLLRSILLSMGVREITTVGTLERMREIPRDRIDILLLRLTPDRIGEGLVRSVRRGAIAIRPNVPVIAYAPTPTIDMVKSILNAGVDEVIALPFTGRSVMGKVNAVLSNPKPMIQVNGHIAPDHTDALQALHEFTLRLM
jgi:DNA-binding response OmpR family regulator